MVQFRRHVVPYHPFPRSVSCVLAFLPSFQPLRTTSLVCHVSLCPPYVKWIQSQTLKPRNLLLRPFLDGNLPHYDFEAKDPWKVMRLSRNSHRQTKVGMTGEQPGRQAQEMTPKGKEEGKMQQSDETEKILRFVFPFHDNQSWADLSLSLSLSVPRLFLMGTCVTQTQTVTEWI